MVHIYRDDDVTSYVEWAPRLKVWRVVSYWESVYPAKVCWATSSRKTADHLFEAMCIAWTLMPGQRDPVKVREARNRHYQLREERRIMYEARYEERLRLEHNRVADLKSRQEAHEAGMEWIVLSLDGGGHKGCF